jgi:hypothetical protein
MRELFANKRIGRTIALMISVCILIAFQNVIRMTNSAQLIDELLKKLDTMEFCQKLQASEHESLLKQM